MNTCLVTVQTKKDDRCFAFRTKQNLFHCMDQEAESAVLFFNDGSVMISSNSLLVNQKEPHQMRCFSYLLKDVKKLSLEFINERV